MTRAPRRILAVAMVLAVQTPALGTSGDQAIDPSAVDCSTQPVPMWLDTSYRTTPRIEHAGDIDSDGSDDLLLWHLDADEQAWLSTLSGRDGSTLARIALDGSEQWIRYDMDCDGFDEVLTLQHTSSEVWIPGAAVRLRRSETSTLVLRSLRRGLDAMWSASFEAISYGPRYLPTGSGRSIIAAAPSPDVTGDDVGDVIVVAGLPEAAYDQDVTVLTLDGTDGRELTSFTRPSSGAHDFFELLPIPDVDGDGLGEVTLWFLEGGSERLEITSAAGASLWIDHPRRFDACENRRSLRTARLRSVASLDLIRTCSEPGALLTMATASDTGAPLWLIGADDEASPDLIGDAGGNGGGAVLRSIYHYENAFDEPREHLSVHDGADLDLIWGPIVVTPPARPGWDIWSSTHSVDVTGDGVEDPISTITEHRISDGIVRLESAARDGTDGSLLWDGLAHRTHRIGGAPDMTGDTKADLLVTEHRSQERAFVATVIAGTTGRDAWSATERRVPDTAWPDVLGVNITGDAASELVALFVNWREDMPPSLRLVAYGPDGVLYRRPIPTGPAR